MRRRLTKNERAFLEEKRAKYETMFERLRRDGGGYTIAEAQLIVRRLVEIRAMLERGWTVTERGARLYD